MCATRLNKFGLYAQCEASRFKIGVAADAKNEGWDGRQNIVAHLAFLFVCVTWGASFILMERATHAFGPVGVAIGRLAGGAAVLAIVWWVQRGRHRVDWADVPRIAGVALVGTAVPFAVQPYCLAQGFGHSYFGMMVGLVPLATIVVSVPMLGVWPTGRQVVGVLGGFVCMLLLVHDGTRAGYFAGHSVRWR